MKISIVLEHEPYGSPQFFRYKKPFIQKVLQWESLRSKRKVSFGQTSDPDSTMTQSRLEIEAEPGDVILWGQLVNRMPHRMHSIDNAVPVIFYALVGPNGETKKITRDRAKALWKENRAKAS